MTCHLLTDSDLQEPASPGRFRPSLAVAGAVCEFLVVAVLLVLLAALVVPDVCSAREAAQRRSLDRILVSVRRQIDHFARDHQGRLPAQGSPVESQFIDQLFRRTTIDGNVDVNGRFGPYLLGTFPANPCNGSARVLVSDNVPRDGCHRGDSAYGWIYSPRTGNFVPHPDAVQP